MARKPRDTIVSDLTVGKKVEIYLDPYMNEKVLCEGLLINKVSESNHQNAFILKDMPNAIQEYFSFEFWDIEVVSVTKLGEKYNYKIGELRKNKRVRVLFNVGITPVGKTSINDVSHVATDFDLTRNDNFNIAPPEWGWGSCF